MERNLDIIYHNVPNRSDCLTTTATLSGWSPQSTLPLMILGPVEVSTYERSTTTTCITVTTYRTTTITISVHMASSSTNTTVFSPEHTLFSLEPSSSSRYNMTATATAPAINAVTRVEPTVVGPSAFKLSNWMLAILVSCGLTYLI
jgi:hypothetical protein